MKHRKTIIREEVLQTDYIAIRDDRGKERSYQDLYHESENLAKVMKERSLVLILCDHHLETLAFVYEVILQNRVPLLLDKELEWEFLENYISVYHPAYIYCNRINNVAKKYQTLLEMEEHVLLSTEEEEIEIHPEVALLLSTSGTTGSSKLVKLSYENLYNNSEYADIHLNIEAGQKGITPLPINYTYGFAFHLWHWHCGATIVTTEKVVLSREFHELFAKQKINHIAAVPFTYQMLNRVAFWDDDKVKQLSWAMSGGAQMSDAEQKNMVGLLGEKFWIGYGQTECTCIVCGMNFDRDVIKLGSIGKAFKNMDVYLDEDTKEMIVHSKSVCMGYANCVEQLKEGDVNGGILHTGDTAYIDEEGCIFLTGRLARFIKILGKRVSLDEIEKYLKTKYNEVEFACVGEDEKMEIYYASMQEEDISLSIKEILVRKMRVPEKFICCHKIDEIPRNESGKIQYKRLKGK